MGDASFKEVLEQQGKPRIQLKNIEHRRDLFVEKTHLLIKTILEKWLKEPIQNGLIEVITRVFTVEDHRIGNFPVSSFKLVIGDLIFTMLPIGIDIERSLGRVDFICSKGIKTMLLLNNDEEGNFNWTILFNDGTSLDLTQHNFENMLKDMIEYAPSA